MISNQIIQNTIDGMKNIARIDICIMDVEGNVVASTFDNADAYTSAVESFMDSQADSQEVQGVHYFKIFDDNHLEYAVVMRGDSDDVYMIGKILVFQLQGLITAYKERYDRDNFIKNLLLDNMLLIDIYNRAKKLHIDPHVRRGVFLVSPQSDDSNALEIVRSLFATRSRDFITALDEKCIIIVKELKPQEGYDNLDKIARMIIDMLNTEAMTNVRVAYGTIVDDLKEVSRSYKEARMALDVGNIFYNNRRVIAYNRLGIGRLIYQLPVQLCNIFIQESFGELSLEDFDEETITTIVKFFENNLNVSETSRQLFIHRNTLVYRLDKIQKSIGLDLRNFDDAITFKIAYMVSKYMKYMENNSY